MRAKNVENNQLKSVGSPLIIDRAEEATRLLNYLQQIEETVRVASGSANKADILAGEWAGPAKEEYEKKRESQIKCQKTLLSTISRVKGFLNMQKSLGRNAR